MSSPVAPVTGPQPTAGGTPPDFEYLLSQQANDAIKAGKDPAAVSKRLGDVVTFLRSNPHVAQQASQAVASGKDPSAVAARAYMLSQGGSIPSGGVSDETDTSHPLPTPAGSPGDVGINALTLGLHPILYGAGQGLKSLIETGSPSAAGHAFTQGRQEVSQSIADANRTKPQESGLLNALGTVGTFAVGGPIESLGEKMGLAKAAAPEVAPEAAAPFWKKAISAAAPGAVTGGAYNAINSDGTPNHRALETLMGVIEGGASSAGARLVDAGATAAGRAANNIFTPVADQASAAADKQIANAIQSDGGVESVLSNARKDYGVTPARSEQLLATSAGPEVNNTVARATQIPGPAGASLAAKINAQKAAEADAIKSALGNASGVTSTTVRPDGSVGADVTPTAYQATNAIDSKQSVSGHRLYGMLDGKSLDDPDILNTIRNNPDLSAALSSSYKIAQGNGYDLENPLTSTVAPGADPAREFIKSMGTQFNTTPESAALMLQKDPELLQKWAGANMPNASVPLHVINHMTQGASDVIAQRLATDKTFTQASGKQLQKAVQDVIAQTGAKYPEFANARMIWANDAARKDAVAAGESAVNKNLPAEQVADEMAGLKGADNGTPFPRPVATQNVPDYKTGAVSALGAKMDAMAPESNVSQLFKSPEDLARVHAILGDEGMEQFNNALNYGKRVEGTAARVASNPASQQDAVRAKFPMGSQPAIGGSVRYSFVRWLRGMHSARQGAFETALGDAMAKRLATDPTGGEGAQFFQKVRGILGDQSAAKVAARAQIAAKRMRALSGLLGVVGAKTGGATQPPTAPQPIQP